MRLAWGDPTPIGCAAHKWCVPGLAALPRCSCFCYAEGGMARGLFYYLKAIDFSSPPALSAFAFSYPQARRGRLWGYEMLKR